MKTIILFTLLTAVVSAAEPIKKFSDLPPVKTTNTVKLADLYKMPPKPMTIEEKLEAALVVWEKPNHMTKGYHDEAYAKAHSKWITSPYRNQNNKVIVIVVQ